MTSALALALAVACAPPQASLVVAAAADLQAVVPELVRTFEARHPGVDVDIVTGSSGTFFAQLQQGAPFDVFLSADVDYVDRLIAAGLADADSRFVYGNGRLVLYAHDAALLSDGRLDVVAGERVGKLALPNPRHAPYGRAAVAALQGLGLYEATRAKFVFGENVAQATQFVDSGAADVGFTALSLALSPALAGRGAWIEVPPTAYPPIVQGGCVLAAATDAAAARAFRAFLLGDDARALLSRAGFVVEPAAAAPVAGVVHPVDTEAIVVTLKLAALTALLLFAIAVPIAWWLASTTSRLRSFVEAVVALPLVLPPTVIGFYVLIAIGPDGVLGAPLQWLLDERLPFTFAGLLIGSVVFNLPFSVRPFAAAFAAVDRRCVEAAWCTGASRLRTFVRVVLPLAAPGLRAGVVLTFAHAVGEFGVVLMVGGSIPGVTRTLSVSIYDDVAALDYASAHQSAAALLVFSLIVLALVGRGQARDPLAT